MTSWAKWTTMTVLMTTGFAAAGAGLPGAAFAGTSGGNAGNVSVLSGNRVSPPVSIPIDVCGIAIAVIGSADANCPGGAMVTGVPVSSGANGTTTVTTISGHPGIPCGPNPGGPNGGPPRTPPGGGTRRHRHHKPPAEHHQKGRSGTIIPGGPGSGSGSTGTTTLTTATQAGSLAGASLPTTGFNLAGILAAALGSLGAGAGALLFSRRRRGLAA